MFLKYQKDAKEGWVQVPFSNLENSFLNCWKNKKQLAREFLIAFFCPVLSLLLSLFLDSRQPYRVVTILSNGLFLVVFAFVSVQFMFKGIVASAAIFAIGLMMLEVGIFYFKFRLDIEKNSDMR